MVTVTAEESSEFIGRDIKECYDNPILLQELLERTDLRFEHEIRFYDGDSNHIEDISVIGKISAQKVDKDKKAMYIL